MFRASVIARAKRTEANAVLLLPPEMEIIVCGNVLSSDLKTETTTILNWYTQVPQVDVCSSKDTDKGRRAKKTADSFKAFISDRHHHHPPVVTVFFTQSKATRARSTETQAWHGPVVCWCAYRMDGARTTVQQQQQQPPPHWLWIVSPSRAGTPKTEPHFQENRNGRTLKLPCGHESVGQCQRLGKSHC